MTDLTDKYGLYEGGWKGVIVDEAFAHPAKFARGLIEWIVDHGLKEGYWHKGGEVTVTEEVRQQIIADLTGAGGVDGIVTSPPYADSVQCGEYRDPKKCAAREERYLAAHPELKGKRPKHLDYGDTPGQIGALKAGKLPEGLE